MIDAVTTADCVLIVAGGVNGISCWGDILSHAASAKGIRGTVVDGVARDIDGSREVGYPVFGRGVTMVSARNRVVQVDAGCDMEMGGVKDREGDYVVADNCGVVFVPAGRVGEVVEFGEGIERRQKGMVR